MTINPELIRLQQEATKRRWQEARIEILPALAGYFLVGSIINEEGEVDGLTYDPIIAWAVRVVASRIGPHDGPLIDINPITIEGEWEDGFSGVSLLVKRPDGGIDAVSDRTWGPGEEQEVIAYLQEQDRRKAAKR